MLSLMEELTSTENNVSFSRQAYNDSVMAYNTQREVFPSNLVAGPFNFKAAELFVIEQPEQREPTKVSTDCNSYRAKNTGWTNWTPRSTALRWPLRRSKRI